MVSTKILVVEDERIVALDIKSSLENLGYAVPAIASSGEAALKKVAETQPDLVLMDINLKGDMDGVETAEKVRANFNIPVIYLTAYADNNTLQRAKVTEPFGYILKPFEEKELNISIEMALYKHQKERQLQASEQWYATTLQSIGDAVIATDQNNFVVFINTIAEALTGWNQEDALGKDLTEVFHLLNKQRRNLNVSAVTKATQEGIVISLPEETTLLAKTGIKIPIAGSAAAIRDTQGNIIGTILIFRAIDKPKQVEAVPLPNVGNTSRTMMDDMALIQTFVQNFLQSQAVLLSNSKLKAEPVVDTLQLIAKSEGLIVKAKLTDKQRTALVKRSSAYWELIHQAMLENSFFPIEQLDTEDFYRYEHRPIPENYHMHCTNAMELWQEWWRLRNRIYSPSIPMDFIILRRGTWYPVRNIICSHGSLYIKTIGDEVAIYGTDMLIWGKKVEEGALLIEGK